MGFGSGCTRGIKKAPITGALTYSEMASISFFKFAAIGESLGGVAGIAGLFSFGSGVCLERGLLGKRFVPSSNTPIVV